MRNEEEEETGIGEVISSIIMIIGVFVLFGFGIGAITNSPTQLEETLEQYNEAVELCEGEDNVRENIYTNGTTDFDCYNYVVTE